MVLWHIIANFSFWHVIVNNDNIAGNKKTEKRTLKWHILKQGLIEAILISQRWHKKLSLVNEFSNWIFLKFSFKGYLCYKIIFCHKVGFDVKLMNFFIWRENHVSFSRYQAFCDFVKSTNRKICDVIIGIAS